GTLIPQMELDPARAAAWGAANPGLAPVVGVLGLFSAFSSPVFLAAIALLAVCTVSCAWARTAAARRILASARGPQPALESLLKRSVEVAGPVDARGADDMLDGAEARLKHARLRVERLDRSLRVSRGIWGAFGSPVFHWSLALLVIVIAAGQMTRAEGRLPVPVDGRVVDAAESYLGRIESGPLFGGHTGLTFAARDFQTKTVIEGIDRGQTAVIAIYRGDVLLAEGRVYPNSPLRYGPLLVHPDTWGYAPVLSIETTSGKALASAYGHIPSSSVTSDGAGPGLLDLSGPTLGRTIIEFGIPATGTDAEGATLLGDSLSVAFRRGDEPTSAPVLVPEGERVPLFDGVWLRFVKRGTYVSVAVANDWSVPFIYALFVIAAIGLTIALFVRPRIAWVFVTEAEGGSRLHVSPRRVRGDPMFIETVCGAIGDPAAAETNKEHEG
ncbi:MAG TPA: cytochrome c biogenesis protein ResB, partial [Coriobacteriia bacterium]